MIGGRHGGIRLGEGGRWFGKGVRGLLIFLEQPERRMKWLFRMFMRLQLMLRTQAALVPNQMKA